MKTKPKITVRIILFLSLLFSAATVFSQKESTIYIGTNGKLTSIEKAIYMQKILIKSPRASVVQYSMLNDAKWEKIGSEQYKKLNDSTWQIKGYGKNIPPKNIRTIVKQTEGLWKFRDVVNEQIIRSGFAKSVAPLLIHGQVTEFYPGGNKKSVSEYNNNELVSNENWSETGDEYIDDIFYSVDIDPAFSRGTKVLQDHILKGYKDAGIDITTISGSIVVGFVVMENGTIDGVKIMKGLESNINEITRESFKTLLGPWTPAKLNNQKVRYFQVYPINFINKEGHIDFAEMRNGILDFGAY